MFGLAVTHFNKFLENSTGYVLAISTSVFPVYEIKSVMAINSDGLITEVNTSVNLDELNKIFMEGNQKLAYFFSGDVIYIYFRKNEYSYTADTKFIITGIRSVLPVKDLEDKIDIPENYLDLFVNYVMKYIYLTKGLKVPSDIVLEINNLEQKLNQ